MKLKHIAALILAAVMMLAVVSCTGTPEATETEPETEPETVTEPQTEPETETETEPETTEPETTEPETTPGTEYAGMESGIVRDGTPKKYFCLCFDDATQQDLKIIETCKKYDYYKVTFFISTGLYGVDWTAGVGVPHVRFTKKEVQSGIYDGFDLAVHTLNHLPLDQYQKSVKKVTSEVETDAKNIYKITGKYPVVMAWPGGDPNVTRTLMKIVYENTSIRLARGTKSTHKFDLPTETLWLEPTTSFSEGTLFKDFQRFLDAECTEDMLFFCWGHGYELDIYKSYDKLDQFIKMVTEAEGIELVTVSEFYQLFKDEIPAYIPQEGD
ncbi:MAG: polysaccharide deacetylase family protein [Clostridia bacterium]|nr:polysaccharide deacetylase family protein [Clostridia bacterium]